MTPVLSALLIFGLCLGQRMRTQADTLSRPSLREENGPLVPRGKNVALRCLASWSVDEYILGKVHDPNWRKIMDMKPSKREGIFHIPSVSENHAATYFCHYRHSSGWSRWSEPLKLVVTGLYPPPSLSALPSSMVASGQDVMFQCHSQGWYDSYALYKDGEEMMQGMAQRHKKGSQANSSISAVTFIHKGTYQCYSFRSQSPQEWSAPSKALVLRVTDTSKEPPLSQSPGSPQTLISSIPTPGTSSPPTSESDNTVFAPVPQSNIICLSLSTLVLIILVILLAEAWHSWREH